MLALNTVNVLENAPKPVAQSSDITEWPLLDSRGNTLDGIGPRQQQIAPKRAPEINKLEWRGKTPETEDESTLPKREPSFDEFSDEDDLDADDDDEMKMAINNRIGNAERNYMYPQHPPVKNNPAKPPMLKFKASLFSRNVLVVNRALRRFMTKDEEPVSEQERNQHMTRRGEGRVRSSKRRQVLSLRNQYTELTLSYDELFKENKILKQIQKRQERELDRYTNADEDLPRLLDANSYEIAGLKAKNKQLLYEKRELDDKLRRQHQEIMSLKENNKKLNALASNKKLGEREKLEMDLTTARVTISHQENKIQDLTKAVEIYKKTADREVKGNQAQLRKVQRNLRELQDAYNELFIKYKAKEKEAGNTNIYAQRAVRSKVRRKSYIPGKYNTGTATLESISTTAKSTPLRTIRRPIRKSSESSQLQQSSLESELDEQSHSLVNLQSVLEENKPAAGAMERTRKQSSSTLGSDSDDDLDGTPLSTPPVSPRKPKTVSYEDRDARPVDNSVQDAIRLIDRQRIQENEAEEKRRTEEARRMKAEEEERRKDEELRLKTAEEERQRRDDEEARQREEARLRREKEDKQRDEEEEARKLAEEEKLLYAKRKKDNAIKEKLAAVRNKGGNDFMSQLKASKKNTPITSPSGLVAEHKSPAQATASERVLHNSGSDDDIRRTAAINSTRHKKSVNEERASGYQPSFIPRKTSVSKKDALGLEINEYTPSFTNNQRVSRESVSKDKSWTPVGRAASSERNGLFNTPPDKNQLVRRRSSQQKRGVYRSQQSDGEDNMETLIL